MVRISRNSRTVWANCTCKQLFTLSGGMFVRQLFTANYARCFLLVFLFLRCSVAACICCPKCALLFWGIFVRGLRAETFVRVLRSSESSLNKCKWYKRISLSLDRKPFILIVVSQVCVTKAMFGNKVQFLVVNRSSVIDRVAWFVDCKNRDSESEYSKTGDFIPNLYWFGCTIIGWRLSRV